ncbi:MAG: acetyl-CoA carboxylase biotin carboxylase subunit [Lachnospiraceae bacterium]|nr:acetyl-CoA carboxylase biotin carboxylase subunit [Lachnospiraceae bacterium]
MWKRILIANRGEIALRIIRCCREMGIETVVVYSKEDEDTLPVLMAGKSICIGKAKASETYLNQDILIDCAKKTFCQAIHPGYGFLSENAKFAKKCEENGIVFIGPDYRIIEKMGNKQAARELMIAHGVPVVPGGEGLADTFEKALEDAGRIGFPVLIKASAGGGGKGMRKVYREEELEQAYLSARQEAKAAFGNDDVYVEKLILNPRHIEFQILADKYGNVIHLGERDCSIQKRNQKLVEESPSVALDENLRKEMGEMAIKAAKAAGYDSAGTIEFILDERRDFYFIEMNTRIQVEHPVTEMLTGIDLIREQIRSAHGRKLSLTQEQVSFDGHVIECRINAETSGLVKMLHFPSGYGVRTDSYLYNGCTISPYYDSMIAKVIVKGSNRLEAIRRMRRSLEELIIEGIQTNEGIMHLLMFHKNFVKGDYNTHFWEEHSETLLQWNREGNADDQ